MNMKETYETEVKARMKSLDAQIDDMAARMDKAGADVQAEYESRLEDIRRRREELQARFTELQASSDAAWSTLRNGFDEALTVFTDSVSEARAQFQKRSQPVI